MTFDTLGLMNSFFKCNLKKQDQIQKLRLVTIGYPLWDLQMVYYML